MNPPEREVTASDDALDAAIDRAIEAFSHTPGGRLRRAFVALATFVSDMYGKATHRQRGVGSPPERNAAEAPAAEVAVPEPESLRAAAQERSLARFVECVEHETRDRDRKLGIEAGSVRTFDRLVFFLLLIAGVATLILAVVGIGLAFGGMLAVGIVSAGIAILPATGTAILFRLQGQLQRKQRELDRKREKNASSLETLRAIIAIDNEQAREREFLQYVEGRRREWVGIVS